jgi:hypothetical protein
MENSFFPCEPTFCLTISATNSYDISTIDCILDGIIEFFLTEKIVVKLIRKTAISMKSAEFVNEIS